MPRSYPTASTVNRSARPKEVSSVGAPYDCAISNDFVHRAFFYRDEHEWLAGLVPFITDAVQADEPVLVAVGEQRIPALRSALGLAAAAVEFVPMELVGKNPGRIISAWHDFVERYPGQRLRGVGEPVWPGRREDEVVECQHHEQLLNLAFQGRDFQLLCPYDIGQLPSDVVDEAHRSHSHLDDQQPNPAFALQAWNEAQLPPAPANVATVSVTIDNLRTVRRMVADRASQAMADQHRIDDLVLAVSEVATNSIEYGGGGVLSLWVEHDRLVCEVTNTGRLHDPLVGRRRPPPDASRGRGVWMANQICDLVQLRTADHGTVVRLTMELTPA
jgi:anti-sigma regulatory factor (Ser/Thr protein kinase)